MTEPDPSDVVDPAAMIAIAPPSGRPGSLLDHGDSVERDVARRITRLMLIRTVVVSLVLGLTFWVAWLNDASMTAPAPLLLLGVIAVTYALTIVYALLLRRGVDPERLVWPQLAGDLAVTSVVVYVTGGAQSAYGFFYGLSVIGAAAVRFRRGAALVAAASLALMITVALLAWAHALPIPTLENVEPWRQSLPELGRSLGLNLAAIVGIGVLALGLGGQLQLTAGALASQRQAVLDLYSLHQDIVRSLSSGLLTVDLDGRVLTLNQTAADILEVADPEATLDRDVDEVVPGLRARLAELGPRDALRRADLEVPRDGEPLVLGISVSPLRDQRDQVVGRVVNFQDLSDMRAMELQIKHAERMAAIGRLAAGIAHEIRNPLASISGSVELLRLGPEVSSDDAALMAIVTRECDRLNSLITELLDFANPRPPQIVEFDLGVMIDETLQVFRQDRGFAGVTVATRGIPAPGPVPVFADPGKLRQVVWNIVRNAAEAAATGGGHVEVELAVEDEAVSVAIRDDGAGIPAATLPHIFDPFFTTKKQGTGLGLATCHSIVHEHGGDIDVDSELGVGTRFVIRLPRDATSQRSAIDAAIGMA